MIKTKEEAIKAIIAVQAELVADIRALHQDINSTNSTNRLLHIVILQSNIRRSERKLIKATKDFPIKCPCCKNVAELGGWNLVEMKTKPSMDSLVLNCKSCGVTASESEIDRADNIFEYYGIVGRLVRNSCADPEELFAK